MVYSPEFMHYYEGLTVLNPRHELAFFYLAISIKIKINQKHLLSINDTHLFFHNLRLLFLFPN